MSSVSLANVDSVLQLLAAGHGRREEDLAAGATDRADVQPEEVDLLDHALQCAHVLAHWHPDDIELQIAGLLHDIGHQLAPGDDAGHGTAAAEAVRDLFGERVAALVAHHVPAKRYLVTLDPDYRSILSATSVHTLANQGGEMTPTEIAAAEALPWWQDGLILRRADEAAKVAGRRVPGLNHWHPVLEQVAERRSAAAR